MEQVRMHRGEEDWIKRDRQMWHSEASRLTHEGYEQRPDDLYGSTFHKDGKTVVLVRSLGTLNWHRRAL